MNPIYNRPITTNIYNKQIFTSKQYKIKQNLLEHKRNIKAIDSVSCCYSVLRSGMDEFQSTQLLNSRLQRCIYLVTYGQVDLTKFPTRKGFGKCIKKHFNSDSGEVKVQHGACAKEKHQNSGEDCHVALKLAGPKRWKSVKEIISSIEEIVVNFSDNHNNYYFAYIYISKAIPTILEHLTTQYQIL